jgi:cytochrome c oxidase subunit II
MFSGPSSYADSVDNVMLYITGTSVLLLIGITLTMIYFVIRYSRKRNPKATQIEGNMALEITWIVIPTIIVMTMFWYGYSDFAKLRGQAEGAQVVQVTAQMWKWGFEYENGKKSDTLYVPAGQPTKLEMISLDVNHSLFIPAFRIKEDVIANKMNFMVVVPKETGIFDIACAEYCGLDHSYMYTKMIVLDEADYKKWLVDGVVPKIEELKETATPAPTEETGILDISQHADFHLIAEKGCVRCHSTDGSQLIGPSFANLRDGKTTIVVDGEEKEIDVDEEYIKQSILDPNAHVVKGYTKFMMPDENDNMTEEEMKKIIAILMAGK